MTHSAEGNQSIETDPELMQMFEGSNMDIKTANIAVFRVFKKLRHEVILKLQMKLLAVKTRLWE